MGPFLRLQLAVLLGAAVLADQLVGLIQTATMKNTLATAYGAAATHAALYTTVPGGSAGTEPTGGSPAYARKPTAWGGPVNGVTVSVQSLDVPAGTTVVGFGLHAGLAGAYLDGGSVTSQPFASQGTYQLTTTYTQT